MSFSLRETRLSIDHCSVSRVAVTLEESGAWKVNFTGRQDPFDVPEMDRPRFVRFERNRFFVTVKLFGQYALATDPETMSLAPPQIVELEVPAFWLERGEMDSRFYSDFSPEVAAYFDVITRIEVDFQYE